MSLEYRGHLFDACVCLEDVARVKLDPTGTGPIRSRFNTALMLRWRRVRIMVRQALVAQNLLGLANGKASPVMVSAMVGGVSRVQMFQRWIDSVLSSMVSGDTMFVRPYIQAGYDAGTQFAETEIGAKPPQSSDDRVGTLAELARVELQGICEAVSQQAVRAVASALLHAVSAPKLARQVQGIVDSVGVTRSTAMVELLVVKAFGEATLDVYSQAGIARVGLIPESRVAKKRIGDARTGPGSRASRSRTPSGSTIGRIARVEGLLSGIGRVEVETAGDDRVCPVCEDIADEGPYTINRARALIPAHPRCRCIFVPVIQGDATFDYNPNHDPDNGQFTSGSGGGLGSGAVAVESKSLTKVSGEFTENEINHVRNYQQGAAINGHLRDLDSPTDFVREIAKNNLDKNQLAAMDSAIAKSRLKEDTVLYRGVNKLLINVPGVGETFRDPAFASTTTDKRIAGGFGDVVQINAPAGTHAVDVSDMLKDRAHYSQGEHILARGMTYRVDQAEPLVLTIVKQRH